MQYLCIRKTSQGGMPVNLTHQIILIGHWLYWKRNSQLAGSECSSFSLTVRAESYSTGSFTPSLNICCFKSGDPNFVFSTSPASHYSPCALIATLPTLLSFTVSPVTAKLAELTNSGTIETRSGAKKPPQKNKTKTETQKRQEQETEGSDN